MRFTFLTIPMLLLLGNAAGATWSTLDGKPPMIIGHRGGGLAKVPEHTVASYLIGQLDGSDAVEPDLVLTKDKKFVCFHDLTLKKLTDVADKPEFKDRKRNLTTMNYGANVTIEDDWLVEDFTLMELQTLRLNQAPDAFRPQIFDGLFNIPSFEDVIEAVKTIHEGSKEPIKLVPELKHPWHYNKYLGEDTAGFMEDLFLDVTKQHGWVDGVHPELGMIIVQSFEKDSLVHLRAKSSDLHLVQLVWGEAWALTPKGLDEVASYATSIGPWKEFFTSGAVLEYKYNALEYDEQEVDDLGGFIAPDKLAAEMHKRGLKIMTYTFYSRFAPSWRWCATECSEDDLAAELEWAMDQGFDGLFCNDVADCQVARAVYETKALYEEKLAAAEAVTSPAVSLSPPTCSIPLSILWAVGSSLF